MDSLDVLRRDVLEALRGPEFRSVGEIPRRWPVLRAHVRAVVRMLLEEGLVERIVDPRSAGMAALYRTTPAGLRALSPAREDAA
jgi:DNA-binding HxlR family transcriptional regulator